MATKKTNSSSSAKRTGSSPRKVSSTGSSGDTARKERSAPRAAAPKRMSGPAVAQAAGRQLLELTGRQAEGITGLQRTDDGWTVHVEVVEVRRVPDTTDVLASYEVEMDTQGDLVGYRRLRRYVRGVPGED